VSKEEVPKRKEVRTELIGRWRGPTEGKDYSNDPVPPEEWPYGPPEIHQDICLLFEGKDYCDCEASDTSTEDN